MTKEIVINASELHRGAGKVLKRVALNEEHLVIERDGYPIAVMVPYPEYKQLMQERALAAHRKMVQALGQEAERQGLGEDQLNADLERAKQEVYQEKYGAK
jgi:prevent-host-death family protein